MQPLRLGAALSRCSNGPACGLSPTANSNAVPITAYRAANGSFRRRPGSNAPAMARQKSDVSSPHLPLAFGQISGRRRHRNCFPPWHLERHTMNEQQLRGLIGRVKAGRMSRRAFVQKMVALGLTAPLANQMLAYNGVAMAATPFEYKPTKRGGGGALKVLWWQGPTLLNPHFAVATKDQEASRIFYEPLAAWDRDGNLVPVLASELPDIEKDTLSHDGKTVTWKLKPGVKWHDGEPLTADDLIFNWQYATDPATAAVTIGTYKDMTVEKIDNLTIRVHFEKPTPFWANPFVGQRGNIIPKHLFEAYKGAKSREAPANLKPVGTGPYRFVSFSPGDMVRGELNPTYHMPNRPYFDTIEMKGGGDAVSAARAVIQTGEVDYAWNIQVEDEILKRMEQGGKGKADIVPGGNIEHIQLNNTDPWKEVDGERS